ncbi:Kelch motif domain-containing protein, related [Eimeria tenella]|uniref:Kelch motif domain-containing protein, related n=1 Tax=Eimeria tenella TaxID=5802 RepID=U6KMK6_EIMTE|nr:Kelch motif domain-containing protein, related [Eimeria tenella]CDJ38046.1 Kelch motif domain-containing protein, related [Eimeria tenella]|eukprot:XP_013228884.1 Kelch motif domain-containing protein, related [Eimeria tenella]
MSSGSSSPLSRESPEAAAAAAAAPAAAAAGKKSAAAANSLTETPRQKGKAGDLKPNENSSKGLQRKASSSSSSSNSSSSTSSSSDRATQEQRVQQSLKNLDLWASPTQERPSPQGPRGPPGGPRGPPGGPQGVCPCGGAPSKGSSPPGFILSLAAKWPGSEGASKFAAVDLGENIGLWIGGSAEGHPEFVLYDSKRQKFEAPEESKEQPKAVSGISLTAFAVGGELGALLFGGLSSSESFLNESWFYSLSKSSWRQLSRGVRTPQARCHHAAAAAPHANALFIFGGQAEGGSLLQDTFKFVDGEWEEVLAEDPPAPRSHHSLSVVVGPHSSKSAKQMQHLLLFGGLVSSSDTNELWLLPVSSKQQKWIQIQDAAGPVPAKRHGHSATAAGSRCFIFGGSGRNWLGWEVEFFDLNAFDCEVSSWFEINLLCPLEGPTSHGHAVATGDPDNVLHILAAGDGSGGEGAIYRLAAVCSSLDLAGLRQAVGDLQLVIGDSNERRNEVLNVNKTLKGTVGKVNAAAAAAAEKTAAAAAAWGAVEAKAKAMKQQVAAAQERLEKLEAQAAAAAAAAAEREGAAAKQLQNLESQVDSLFEKVNHFESLLEAAKRQDSSDEEEESE